MASISWKSGVSGDWTNKNDWTGGAVPGAGDDVTIAVAGSFDVYISTAVAAHSLTLNSANAEVVDTGTLTLGSTLSLTAGVFYLQGGEISGGTLSASGGGFAWNQGFLDGVTYDGTLNLSGANARLNITANGITLKGAGGTGSGTVNLTGASAGLYFLGSQTLNNATVDVGNTHETGLDQKGGGTLTLGASLTVDQAGRLAEIGAVAGAGAVINDGSIVAAVSGGYLLFDPGSFTNAGAISISNGENVYVRTGSFTNTGSITVASGGDLFLYANLTTASLKGVSNSGGGIQIEYELNNTGATLNVGAGSSLGSLEVEGTISGGVIADAGSGMLFNDGTLDGVTYDGTLNLSASRLNVTANGITLKGAGGTGPGTVELTGPNTSLVLEGSQTLANATVYLGAASADAHLEQSGAGGTLTLGATLTINQAGRHGEIGDVTGTGAVVNDGSIAAGVSGGYLIIDPGSFTNAGAISISNGDEVGISGAFANTGSIAVTSGGGLYFDTNLTTASLNGVTNNGGVVEIAYELNNAGATLNVGSGSSLGSLLVTGTISGGVIADGGSGIVFSGGTLDGVTYEGTLDLSASRLNVTANGITLKGAGGAGPGKVELTGANTALYLEGSQTLANATVYLGAASGANAHLVQSGGGTLTLAASLTVDQTGRLAEIGASTTGVVINDGSIAASISGGRLAIDPTSFVNAGVISVSNGDYVRVYPGIFTNTGSIAVTSGGYLYFDTSLTTASLTGVTNSGGTIGIGGLLNNVGGTLSVGTGSALESLDLAGTISGGTIADGGGGIVSANGTLDGVTYEGTLDVSASNTRLYVTSNGITLKGAGGVGNGTVNDTGNSSHLYFENTQTVDNATIYLGSSVGSTSYLLQMDTGAPGGTLTLGAGLTVDVTGKSADIGGIGADKDTIINNGTIDATASGGYLDISPFRFTNNGAIDVSNGGTVSFSSTTLTNLSGTTLTGGRLEADAASTLQLASTSTIVTDAATIILSGAGSTLQALNKKGQEVTVDTTLATIAAAGALEILAGRNWTNALATTNAGSLQLGGGAFTVASLANSGTLSGFGTVATSVTNTGAVSAAAGQTLTLSGVLTNLAGTTLSKGTFAAGAGGVLQLANNVTITTLAAAVDLTGAGSTVQSLNTGTSSEVGLEATLSSITSAGVLEVLGGRGWSGANALANAGVIQLGGGTFSGGALSEAAGATLTGFGTVSAVFGDAGGDAVISSGGTLAFTATGDTFSTALAGTEIDFAGGTDLLQSGSSLTAGAVGVSGGAVVTFAVSQAFAGVLTEASGATLALGANTLTLTGTGSTLAGTVSGTGTLAFAGGTQAVGAGASFSVSNWTLSGADAASLATNLAYAGSFGAAAGSSLSIGAADTLTLTGAASFAGTVSGAGTLALAGGADTLAGGASFGSALSLAAGAAVSVTGAVSVSGALAQAAGNTVTIGGGDTLTLTGAGSTLAGTIAGAGTLALAGGTQTFNSGAAITAAAWSLSGGDAATLTESLAYAGDLSEAAGTTLAVKANTLTLSGTGTSLAGAVTGTGTLAFTGGTQAINAGASLGVSNWSLTGTDATSINASLKYAGVFSAGAGTSVTIASGDTLSLTGTSTLAGSMAGAGTLAFTGGTASLTAGAGLTMADWSLSGGAAATLAGSLAYAGALSQGSGTSLALGANTLTLTGTGSSLAGTISGTAALAFTGGTQALNAGASITVSSWGITGTAAASVNTTLTYAGRLTQGGLTTLTLSKNDSLTLTGAADLAGTVSGAGTLSLSGGTATFENGASFASAVSITGEAVSVNGPAAVSGALSQATGTTITIGSGDSLTLSGSGSALAGTIAGSGATLAITGGTQAINAGAALTVANWSLTGGTATLNTSLTYAGSLTEASGATLAVITGQKLTTTGAASFSGVVDGAGTLKVSSATVNGLTIGGTATFNDAGSASQTGAVTLGDATSAIATLMINTGATWSIGGDFGIALGHSKKSVIKNSGTIVKAAGTGVSVIAPKVIDTGSLIAASGTLDFLGAITGTGTMTVDAGATLEAASSAVSTLSMSFSGVGGTLALGKAKKFAATIGGFAAGDTIDLVGTKATSAVLNGSDQLVITNGTKAVATLQLTGTYTGDTFQVASDGNGGTDITVTGPEGKPPPAMPAIPFVSAMAGWGAAAHAGHLAGGGLADLRPPLLSRPHTGAP